MVSKLASAIYNDVVSGLAGITSNPTMSLEQLEDDVVDERLQIIKEYSLKNLIPRKDLMMSINCIDVDCKSLDKCPCGQNLTKPELHFEIPQLINDFGEDSVEFIGSINRETQYKIYTSTSFQYHKYSRRGANHPYVYIETTPNENNMYDGWVFNIPLLKRLSIIGIFKDLRQLDNYGCCTEDLNNMTFIDTEIKKRLTEKKLRYYRQLLQAPHPNDQVPR